MTKKILSCRVIEEQKNYFQVDSSQGLVRAGIKGALKKERARICSGDIVDVELMNSEPPEGIITKVHKRKNFLPRPALANIDLVFFIHTIKEPPIDLDALDRFLFSAEVYMFRPIIVFNKIDILTDTDIAKCEEVSGIYKNAGYEILHTSAVTCEGVDKLVELCKNHISAFTGLSGVGKSTLLSKIFPDIDFRIGKISDHTQRGTHTTTNTTLHKLSHDGYIADTPGLSFVNIPEVPDEMVSSYFPELCSRIGQCKYNNCTHHDEPGCMVESLIQNNEIANSRMVNYRKIYKEMFMKRKSYKAKN